jgi:hypothetical protein
MKYQGRPHDLKAFDEITHFTEAQFRTLIGWLRTDNPNIRQRVVAAGNPPTTPEGEWVKYDDIKHLLKNTSLVLKLKKLDCGSSACRFAQDKSGQRTNSGCTCLQGIPDSVRIEIEKIFINYKMNGFE